MGYLGFCEVTAVHPGTHAILTIYCSPCETLAPKTAPGKTCVMLFIVESTSASGTTMAEMVLLTRLGLTRLGSQQEA